MAGALRVSGVRQGRVAGRIAGGHHPQPRLAPHYASVLLMAGESVVAVAERLGHEDAKLVLEVYGHLLPGSEDRTRLAVDAAWNTLSTLDRDAGTAQGWPR